MGSNQSSIIPSKGTEFVQKKCILLVTPPGYETTKLIQQLPKDIGYNYVSVGQMIRDEINKKTKYSQIILKNLQKYHKINEDILEILLKNIVLLGNFIIRFTLRDQQQLSIWKKFIKRVNIQIALIIKPVSDPQLSKRSSFKQKTKQYENDVINLKKLVSKQQILQIQYEQNIYELIRQRMTQPKQ